MVASVSASGKTHEAMVQSLALPGNAGARYSPPNVVLRRSAWIGSDQARDASSVGARNARIANRLPSRQFRPASQNLLQRLDVVCQLLPTFCGPGSPALKIHLTIFSRINCCTRFEGCWQRPKGRDSSCFFLCTTHHFRPIGSPSQAIHAPVSLRSLPSLLPPFSPYSQVYRSLVKRSHLLYRFGNRERFLARSILKLKKVQREATRT